MRTPRFNFTWSAATRRDGYIALVIVASGALFLHVATHPTSEPWNLLCVAVLFIAMVMAERMSVPLPKQAAISIASIPHTIALLLLPVWLAMLLAGASMLLDQLLARAPARKTLFNTASVSLTVGVTALVADWVGLTGGQLASNQWQQVPAFLVVACTYYCLTNGLVAIVVSITAERPAYRIFLDNARFVLPAEFAVCGIGALVTIVWVLCPAWTPVVLFPAIVSQVAFQYVTSSKRNQTRLEFIAEASRLLAMSLDPKELSTSVARLIVSVLADSAVVVLSEADGTLAPAAMAIAAGDGESRDVHLQTSTWEQSGLAATAHHALESGLRIRLDSSANDLNCCVWPNVAQPVQSGVVVSVHSAGRKFGALLVQCTVDRPLATGDAEVLEELGRRFAVALENARLHAEAQRATQLRDDFLSVAAHELKTPVTSLRGYAQLLVRSADAPDPAMLLRGLQTIDIQSDKLRQLTDKLLDVSRIDSGKLRLEPREVDIAELVRGCVATAQDATDFHTLSVNTPATCHGWIDPLRFEQVVANLLSNAIKYSPDGGEIEVRLSRRGDECVVLQVRDHGLGIPAERRARLFDRMYQAHGDGYLSGLGLGLFISRQIVEFHGGSIEAAFPPDGGTEMTVKLPLGSG